MPKALRRVLPLGFPWVVRRAGTALLIVAGVALPPTSLSTIPVGASMNVARHLMVIVEENREYGSVIGAADAPYVNTLARTYGLATASSAVAPPSLPNYLELLSGTTWGITDDGTGYVLPGPTLVDQLASKGAGWRAYMESMPGSCYGGAFSGEYAKKHDPFMYFASITQNPPELRERRAVYASGGRSK